MQHAVQQRISRNVLAALATPLPVRCLVDHHEFARAIQGLDFVQRALHGSLEVRPVDGKEVDVALVVPMCGGMQQVALSDDCN